MTSKNDTLENDYERMVPEFHRETLIYAEHITRYLAAEKIVAGKTVLDIASGSGYGTQLLARYASKVYGVDVDETSVNYARKNYGAPNVEYRVGDGESIPLEDNSVDVVITFETIEHIQDYKKFVKELSRVLKPDGLAIVSTPNDLEFAEGNHFHLHEFEYEELVTLLKDDFKNIDSYYQATWKYVAVGDEAMMRTDGKLEVPTTNFSPKPAHQYLYFYLLCSNRKITEKVEPIAALGEHYSDRQIVKELSHYQNEIKALKTSVADKEKESQAKITYLEQQIATIKNSKSYRVAQTLARTKSKIARKK